MLMAVGAVVSSLKLPLISELDGIWEEWKTEHGRQYAKVYQNVIWDTVCQEHNLAWKQQNDGSCTVRLFRLNGHLELLGLFTAKTYPKQ